MEKLKSIDADSFENITYDVLTLSGFQNLIWRTPGRDGGRDIEGVFLSQDASGYHDYQRWYIECKRYATTISWPVVWEKLAYADSGNVDYLLIVTTATVSPQAVNEIDKWNTSHHRPKVRIWQGYELERKFKKFPQALYKYGLLEMSVEKQDLFNELTNEVTKSIHSVYGASCAGLNVIHHIEFSAAIAELLSKRMQDLKDHGRFFFSPLDINLDSYEWLDIGSSIGVVTLDRLGMRAILTAVKLISKSPRLLLNAHEKEGAFSISGFEVLLGEKALFSLKNYAFYSDFDVFYCLDRKHIDLVPRE